MLNAYAEQRISPSEYGVCHSVFETQKCPDSCHCNVKCCSLSLYVIALSRHGLCASIHF